ncbi:MAG: SMP-30/gluconolactonase/LRE family protein [Acidimicrobiales bacterium]
MTTWNRLVDGIDFGEGPRWHDGRLWYSDFYQRTIYSVGEAGDRVAEHGDLPDRPSGLGWMPDGSLLAVFMTQRRLMRFTPDGTMTVHADLGHLAAGNVNDMVVAANGDAYVGNFGFDFEAGEEFAPATLILVRADGTVSAAADDLAFPNGSVITPDGSTLVVGESFAGNYVAFTIEADGALSGRRDWAAVDGMIPDGCSMDAAGGIWFSDARGSQVVRVEEGGAVTDRVATPDRTFACALGGADGRTLFALCAPGSHPDEVAGRAEGAIYTTRVDHPHTGLP